MPDAIACGWHVPDPRVSDWRRLAGKAEQTRDDPNMPYGEPRPQVTSRQLMD